mmetsp:Transcript_20936/g.45592  ORF Transcript_20936/g.45592 Transcript_20936/m.45592 type:complete len:101 (-) Transcript_20936:810-1112(-)
MRSTSVAFGNPPTIAREVAVFCAWRPLEDKFVFVHISKGGDLVNEALAIDVGRSGPFGTAHGEDIRHGSERCLTEIATDAALRIFCRPFADVFPDKEKTL